MSTVDLSPFAGIIARLKYQHAHKSLNTLIRREAGKELSGPLMFHIKSEISRLSKPSSRPFHVDQLIEEADGRAFKYRDITHYVDDITKPVLETELKRYGGSYTVGVEEHMTAYVKQNADTIRHYRLIQDVGVTPIDVSERIYRREERMHLGVKGKIHLVHSEPGKEDDFDTLRKGASKIDVVTQNISFSGLRLKTQQTPGTKYCLVRLTGLENDFVISRPYVAYEIMAYDLMQKNDEDGEQWYSWSLRKIDLPQHNEYNMFIRRIINANRNLYKVDMGNIERSVKHHMAEQFMTNRQEELTLFQTQGGDIPFAFGNHMGQDSFNSFHSSCGNNTLPAMLSKDGLSDVSHGKPLFWAVIKQSDRAHFSAAWDGSPKNRAFFQYALARKDSDLYIVTRQAVDSERAFVSHSLPVKEKSSEKMARQRRLTDHYADNTREAINAITHCITVRQIDKSTVNSFIEPLAKVEKSQHAEFTEMSVRKVPENNLRFIKSRSRELRTEDRFALLSPVTIETREEKLAGHTVDVSGSGCAVKLSDDTLPLTNQLVKVRFNELSSCQNIAPEGRYRVVDDQRGNLRLVSALEKGKTDTFLSAYLDKHFNELDPLQERDMVGTDMIGLERALRNLQNSALPFTKALVQYHNSRVVPTLVNVSDCNMDGFSLPNRGEAHEANTQYKKWLCDISLQKSLNQSLRDINTDNPFVRQVMMMVVEPKTQQILRVQVHDPKQLSPHVVKGLINTFAKRDLQVLWFQLDVTRKSRVFDRYYREELDYVQNMSPHRGDALYDLMKKTSGVITCIPLNGLIEEQVAQSAPVESMIA